MSTPDFSGLPDRIAGYRRLRAELEAAVLPLATSLDGRRFTVQASLHNLRLSPGGYVAFMREDGTGKPRLGLLESLELVREEVMSLAMPGAPEVASAVSTRIVIRSARGEGRLVDGDPTPFHDLLARPADSPLVRDWLAAAGAPRAPLPIGGLATVADVPYPLDARGFDRHTFFCGQSGSGKTYSLGVVLEQLLLRTQLRVVVLDPNSDFVRLREAHPSADPEAARSWAQAAAGIAVHGAAAAGGGAGGSDAVGGSDAAGGNGAASGATISGGDAAGGSDAAGGAIERLRLRFDQLDPAAHAALLRLDPIADGEEYAELVELFAADRPDGVAGLERALADSPLATRARNLGVDRFALWARDEPGSLLETLDRDDWRCLVVDLGSLPSPQEQALTSGAVLAHLWEQRARRRPLLIVIDEAHNVCPADPTDALSELSTETAVRIAAEGRKFGLYLLVSTQRPQKVHQNVVSQCDNLVLMRLNAAADAAYAADVFSFVPPALVQQATRFGLGESLVAGRISPQPALVRFGARVAREGGADVPADWA